MAGGMLECQSELPLRKAGQELTSASKIAQKNALRCSLSVPISDVGGALRDVHAKLRALSKGPGLARDKCPVLPGLFLSRWSRRACVSACVPGGSRPVSRPRPRCPGSDLAGIPASVRPVSRLWPWCPKCGPVRVQVCALASPANCPGRVIVTIIINTQSFPVSPRILITRRVVEPALMWPNAGQCWPIQFDLLRPHVRQVRPGFPHLLATSAGVGQDCARIGQHSKSLPGLREPRVSPEQYCADVRATAHAVGQAWPNLPTFRPNPTNFGTSWAN